MVMRQTEKMHRPTGETKPSTQTTEMALQNDDNDECGEEMKYCSKF